VIRSNVLASCNKRAIVSNFARDTIAAPHLLFRTKTCSVQRIRLCRTPCEGSYIRLGHRRLPLVPRQCCSCTCTSGKGLELARTSYVSPRTFIRTRTRPIVHSSALGPAVRLITIRHGGNAETPALRPIASDLSQSADRNSPYPAPRQRSKASANCT